MKLLARSELRRLGELEIFATGSEPMHNLLFVLALAATPGTFFATGNSSNYALAARLGGDILDRMVHAHQVLYIDFTMAVTGLITMMAWGRLTPDRRDATVLGALPLSPSTLAFGRLLALGGLIVGFAVASNVLAALVFPTLTQQSPSIIGVFAAILAHLVATSAAALFICLTLIVVQIIAAASFGPRGVRVLSFPFQVAALVGFIAAVAGSTILSLGLSAARGNAVAASGFNLAPPAWFVGLYRVSLGDSDPLMAALAQRAAIATTVVIIAVLVLYPLLYTRLLRQSLAEQATRPRFQLRLPRMLRLHPLTRFFVVTAARSPDHRLLAGMYVGLGVLLALPLADNVVAPTSIAGLFYAIFAVPLGVLFWTLAGVRVAFGVPMDIAANWIFRMTESRDRLRYVTRAHRALLLIAVGPLAVLGAAPAWIMLNRELAVQVVWGLLLAGVVLAELLLLQMRKIPYTCTYQPGSLKLRSRWPVYLAAYLLFTFMLADVGVWMFDSTRRTASVTVVAVLVWGTLRAINYWSLRNAQAIVFDNVAEPQLESLNLSGPVAVPRQSA